MKINNKWPWLTVMAIALFSCQHASGASLVGKVIEINDGDEITIFNLNRPVRIRLIGIDAPEKEQAFGAAAKQHLSDLVYDKVVSVEYSGIGQHSSLIGRVLLNDIDISAQMVRDGAAWFDPNNKGKVSDAQRDIYMQCERAARSEKRGLWQTDDAVAPWDFVKAEEQKRNPVTTNPNAPAPPVKRDGPAPELNNLLLLRTGTTSIAKPQSAVIDDDSDQSWATQGSFHKNWHQLKPEGENFSVLVPEGGKQKVKSLPFQDRTIDVNSYQVRDGYSLYQLMWVIGPNQEETDAEAIRHGLAGIYKGMNTAFQASGVGTFDCEPLSERNISSAGFAGREFDLSGCPLPGMARVYTRLVGSQRQFYIGVTFYNELDENVSKFMNSFKVSAKGVERQKTKATN